MGRSFETVPIPARPSNNCNGYISSLVICGVFVIRDDATVGNNIVDYVARYSCTMVFTGGCLQMQRKIVSGTQLLPAPGTILVYNKLICLTFSLTY